MFQRQSLANEIFYRFLFDLKTRTWDSFCVRFNNEDKLISTTNYLLDISFHFAAIFKFSISLSFPDVECCFHFNYLFSLGDEEVTTKVSLRLELPTLEVSNLEQKCLPQLFTSLSRRQNYLFQIWTAWYSLTYQKRKW